MNTIQNGQIVPNDDEIRAQGNEKKALKAIPLTPQEDAQEEAKQRQKEYEEKAKQKKWTKEDLIKLAFNYKIDSLGGETLLSKEDHEKQGEPAELQKDIKILRTVLLDEKRTIALEGIEKDKIIDGTNFLYGLVLDWHIMSQGFTIHVVGNEPKILPAEQNPTTERQERAQKIQAALNGEGGQDFGYYTDIKQGTKMPVLSNYIATETFHRVGQKGKSLETYRSELEKMIGGDGVTPLDEKKILDSSLNGQQKSFLLSWSKRTDDTALRSIADHETRNVVKAREEWNKKSELEKKAYLRENGLKSSLIYIGGLALMTGLLVAGIKTLKDGSWWKKILLGVPAVLIGGGFLMDKLQTGFNEYGGQKLLEPFTTARPTDKKDAERNKVNLDISIVQPTKDLWNRFETRLAGGFVGGQGGIDILINKEVGQDIATKYPVYSMLNSLDPDGKLPTSTYAAPDETLPGADIDSIKNSLEKLEKQPNQKVQLNTLLADTWERYKKTGKYNTDGADKSKATNLADMLKEIEKEDGWFNKVIDTVSNAQEKKGALRVIGQNPQGWGECTLGELETTFTPFGDERDADENFAYTTVDEAHKDTIRGYLPTDGTKFPDPNNDIVKYLKTIGKDKLKEKSTLKLRDFLAS